MNTTIICLLVLVAASVAIAVWMGVKMRKQMPELVALKKDLDNDAFVIRFPGGSSNTVSAEYSKGIMSKLVKKVQKEGYLYNDWNVDGGDNTRTLRPHSEY